MGIQRFEAAKGGPFRFRHRGETFTLPPAADVPFQLILAMLEAEHVPGCPPMADWKAIRLFRRWAAHNDLPSFQNAQRLTYLMDKYGDALVSDLQVYAGVDVGELWRSRRWSTLLDIIDRLPGHSWYTVAVSSDEEHAKMLAESLAAREGDGMAAGGPPLHTWTPEVAAITALRDDVRALHYLIPAVQGDKKVKPPEPLARPKTPLEAAIKRAEFARRQVAHESLVARMLPHKAKKTD